jgi:acyl carrier protein
MSHPAAPSPAVLQDVTAAIRGVLHAPHLTLGMSTPLAEIAGWDTLDMIPVIVELECRHDILFELPEIDALQTVGDLVRGVAAKRCLQAA